MEISCKLYGPLREQAGKKQVSCRFDGEVTVGDVLNALVAERPALESWIYDQDDALDESVGILVNGRNIRQLKGLETPVSSSDEVLLTPPVHGG